MVYNESPEMVVSVDHMKKSKVSGDYQLTDFFRSKYHGFHDSLVLIIVDFLIHAHKINYKNTGKQIRHPLAKHQPCARFAM